MRKKETNKVLIINLLRRLVGCLTGVISTIEIKDLLFDEYKKLGCLNQAMFDKFDLKIKWNITFF